MRRGTLTLTDATTGETLVAGPVDPTSPSVAVDRMFAVGPHHRVALYSGFTSNEDPSSGSIDLTIAEADTVPPSGSIAIAGGSAYVTTAIVPLVVSATDAPSGVTQVALSNDGLTWTPRPYVPNQSWTLSAGDGMKTVYAKWQDGAGNWSAPVSDSIVLDTKAPSGTVSIDGGATTTGTTSVTVAVYATDATSGLSYLALSNDGSTWTTQAYAATVPWILTPANGTKTVLIKWQDGAGNWSDPASDTIVLETTVADLVAPAAMPPTQAFVAGSPLTGGQPPVRFDWSGTDAGSGIDHYEFGLSTDGGAYVTVAFSVPSPSLTRTLAPGHTYRAGVRATDVAGNVSAWAYGASFKLTAYQESSRAIRWSGTWHTGSSSSFLGGHDRYRTASGTKASLTLSGRTFAWVGSVGPSRGWARVYVNGILVRSVNLNAASSANRRVLFATTWSTATRRTVTIRINGTARHPRVDVDAFLTGS